MKKLVLFLIFITLTLSMDAQRRKAKRELFRLGLKEGITTSQITGDDYTGFKKLGMTGGIFVRKLIDDYWSAQVEVLFTERGSKFQKPFESPEDALSREPNYLLRLRYLEVPLLGQFMFDQVGVKGLSAEAGLTYAFLLDSKEYIHTPGYNTPQVNNDFKKSDLLLNIGANYHFKNNFSISLRFSRSLIKVRELPKAEDIEYPTVIGTAPYTFSDSKGSGQKNTTVALSILYNIIFK